MKQAAVVLVLLFVVAPLSAVRGEETPVRFDFTIESRSGSLVYRVELPAPGPVELDWRDRRDDDSSGPFLIHFLPEGFPARRYMVGSAFSRNVDAGLVYVGIGESTIETPDPTPGVREHGTVVTFNLPSSTLHLVLTWDRQVGGSRLNFTWPAGTEITLVAEGSGKHHEMEDFSNGAHLGVPAAFRANVLDRIVFHPAEGRQLFGWMHFIRTDLLGIGALNITRGESFSRNMSFTKEYDVNERCFCTSQHHWIFTSTEQLTVRLTSIGENQSIFTLFVADLPAVVLPDRYWHEYNLYSPSDERPGNGKE